MTVIGIGEEKTKRKADLNRACQLIRNAIERGGTDDEWVPLDPVDKSLRVALPDFDTRSFGFAKLNRLIRSLDKLEFTNRDKSPKVRIKA